MKKKTKWWIFKISIIILKKMFKEEETVKKALCAF
jgi:hypothetical protein